MHSFLSSSSTSVSVIKFTTIRPYRDLSIKPHFLTHVHVNLMFAAADIAVSSPVFLSALLYSCQLSCIPVSYPVFLSAILFSCQLSCIQTCQLYCIQTCQLYCISDLGLRLLLLVSVAHCLDTELSSNIAGSYLYGVYRF